MLSDRICFLGTARPCGSALKMNFRIGHGFHYTRTADGHLKKTATWKADKQSVRQKRSKNA